MRGNFEIDLPADEKRFLGIAIFFCRDVETFGGDFPTRLLMGHGRLREVWLFHEGQFV